MKAAKGAIQSNAIYREISHEIMPIDVYYMCSGNSSPSSLVPRGFDKITISYDRFLESHFRTAPSLII